MEVLEGGPRRNAYFERVNRTEVSFIGHIRWIDNVNSLIDKKWFGGMLPYLFLNPLDSVIYCLPISAPIVRLGAIRGFHSTIQSAHFIFVHPCLVVRDVIGKSSVHGPSRQSSIHRVASRHIILLATQVDGIAISSQNLKNGIVVILWQTFVIVPDSIHMDFVMKMGDLVRIFTRPKGRPRGTTDGDIGVMTIKRVGA
jgi:hypothetical protein